MMAKSGNLIILRCPLQRIPIHDFAPCSIKSGTRDGVTGTQQDICMSLARRTSAIGGTLRYSVQVVTHIKTSTDMSGFPPPLPGKAGWPWNAQPGKLPVDMKDCRAWFKISIVTPSFNQAPFLEETIRSVLLQGYPNLEYIIIDGGSTDDSPEIIRRYEPWLTYWTSEPDDGQAGAIRRGFQQATGDILAWINSDDTYEIGALARAADFFSDNPDMVFANGDVNLVDRDSQFIRRVYAMRPSLFLAANSGKHGWPQQGCFWRRSTYEQVGGIDASLQFCMDKDLFIRLINAGPGRRLPGPPLANFRIHEQAKSSTLQDIAQSETAAIIEKYGQRKWSSRRRLMGAYWWLYRKQAALRMRAGRFF